MFHQLAWDSEGITPSVMDCTIAQNTWAISLNISLNNLPGIRAGSEALDALISTYMSL